MIDNDYECASCHETFEKGWTDEESIAEYEADFCMKFGEEPTDVICDDCYKEFTNWRKKG